MGWREMKRLAGCGFCFLTCYHLTSTTGSPQMSPAVLVTTWTESKHSDSGWGKPLSLKTPLSPLETDSDHPNTGNKQKQILTFIFYHNSWTNTTWSDHHEQDSIKLWPLCILLNTWSPRQSKVVLLFKRDRWNLNSSLWPVGSGWARVEAREGLSPSVNQWFEVWSILLSFPSSGHEPGQLVTAISGPGPGLFTQIRWPHDIVTCDAECHEHTGLM